MGHCAGQSVGPAHHFPNSRVKRNPGSSVKLDQQLDWPLPQDEGIHTMSIGFDKQLYVLPFDHRGSFQTKMFGWNGPLTPEQTGRIAAAKQVIYDGFKRAVAGGVPQEKAGILVDEQFGAAILRDAAEHGFITACPAEKSAQDEFDFEYGEDFGKHIDAFHPTFCKVLVHYNPEGDQGLNQRQAARLSRTGRRWPETTSTWRGDTSLR
jgi:myo-inositol catabolism protein IolC